MATLQTPVSGQAYATKKSIHQKSKGVILIITEEDQTYLHNLSSSFKDVPAKVYLNTVTTLTEIIYKAKAIGYDAIATTRLDVLQKLLPPDQAKKAKISNYAGSIITYKDFEFLILHPLKQLRTVSYGEFLASTYISKLTAPYRWREPSQFNWKLIQNEADFQVAKSALLACDLIGMDTETAKWNCSIRMSGYCGIRLEDNTSMTYVIPMKGMHSVRWMRELNALPIGKVMQNGKYDLAYYARFGAPVSHYFYDTVNAMHSQYSELPKDLGSIGALYIRNHMYWKDLAESGDAMDGFRYNALDCWATVEAWLAWLASAPAWAKKNYVMEFSLTPSLHLCEMRGLRRDVIRTEELAKASEEKQSRLLQSLRTMTGYQAFNPSSHVMVKNLMRVLGEKDPESSDEKSLTALAFKHPLNERITNTILEYRGERKETSTYLSTGDKAKEFGTADNRRILFALNAHGTDTGRLASKEHHFWCGLQVQNVTGGSEVKSTLIADPGFELYEFDFSQAEDRGVAHKSGDAALLEIFSSNIDSHSYKAAMFFGVKYEDIWDVEKNKVNGKTGKDLRDLGKRVNHGSNYNMGARVLVDTMGAKKIRMAQTLLKLPKSWDLIGVAQHLLNQYEKAFPTVKKEYYRSIIKDIKIHSKLVGDTGWTRYCFGDPSKNKLDLNAYVAHVTQSLNAMILNIAFKKIFNALGFNPNFILHAQIHDSVLAQIRIGHEYLAEEVMKLMTFPVPVTDCHGVTRDMLVPVDMKRLGRTWKGD